MTLQEKYEELQKLLGDDRLQLPPPEVEEGSREEEFTFIVSDHTSDPSPDFRCYAELESNS